MRPLDQGSTSLGIICDNHLLNLICAILWINLGKVELKSKRQLAETTTKNKKPSKPMQQKCLRLLKTSFSHLECGGGEQVRAAASSGRGWARYVCCSYKSQTFPIQKQLPLKAAGLSVEGPRGFILQLDCKFTANNWNNLLLCVFLYQTAAAGRASLCWWWRLRVKAAPGRRRKSSCASTDCLRLSHFWHVLHFDGEEGKVISETILKQHQCLQNCLAVNLYFFDVPHTIL